MFHVNINLSDSIIAASSLAKFLLSVSRSSFFVAGIEYHIIELVNEELMRLIELSVCAR